MQSNTKLCSACKEQINKDATACPHCKTDLRNWFVRHWIISLLLILFVGLPVMSNVKKLQEFENEVEQTASDTKAIIGTTTTTLSSPEAQKILQDKLALLQKKFKYREDEFDKVGWYTPLSQAGYNSFNHTGLLATVRKDGYVYMESVYIGSDWLFHTKVRVTIDGVEQVYESEDVPTFSPKNKREVGGGGVSELVSYLNGGDNGIIKTIAENTDKNIKVRFDGRNTVKDIVLRDSDKQAIKDAYELSVVLKGLQQ